MNTLYVNPNTRREDIECILLARLGFSTALIVERTGLSHGQISHRLKIAGVKLADYRNGASDVGKHVAKVVTADSAKYLSVIRDDIQKLLAHTNGDKPKP